MNRFPLWKNLLVVVAVLAGLLISLPNLFGEAPAVQVGLTSGEPLTNSGIERVNQVIASQQIEGAAPYIDKGRLIVGVDLKKDVDVLLPAYDDAAGVTAAFNLNLLQRMNRELGADFVLAQWAHLACWNDDHGRVEMHLRSTQAQRVQIAGRCFDFAEGETIHTENSHKYQLSEFRLLARAAGWEPRRCWTDDQQRFALFLLS